MRFGKYRRKSEEAEDRQIASLTDQDEALTRLEREQGLHIVEDFEEAKSAKIPHKRTEFNRLIDLIRKGKIDGILCWKLNRLARNSLEAGQIAQLLQDGNIKIIKTPNGSYFPGDNIITLMLEFALASQFSIDLSRDVKRGLRSKALRGWYPGSAPLGYHHR